MASSRESTTELRAFRVRPQGAKNEVGGPGASQFLVQELVNAQTEDAVAKHNFMLELQKKQSGTARSGKKAAAGVNVVALTRRQNEMKVARSKLEIAAQAAKTQGPVLDALESAEELDGVVWARVPRDDDGTETESRRYDVVSGHLRLASLAALRREQAAMQGDGMFLQGEGMYTML